MLARKTNHGNPPKNKLEVLGNPWEGNSAQEGNSRVKVTQVRMYTPAKRQVNSIQAVEKNNEEGSRMEFAKAELAP
jgi:hypothetical protein